MKTYATRTGGGWFMRQARKSQEQPPHTETMTDSSIAIQPRKTSQEVAASASAALAKATIEAKFVIASRPESRRNEMLARSKMLEACKRPIFAERARFRKKQGRKEVNGRWEDHYVEGFTIRFAETAIQAWKNVDISATTAWETDEQRLVRITVTDLESNISYCDEALLEKTVERKKVKEGQEVIGERETSDGNKVYIVRATDDELQNKVNAAKSKSIRNSGLRLIPEDFKEEALEQIVKTLSGGALDPKAETKKVVDAFAELSVSVADLEAYLKHPVDKTSKRELMDLRLVYSAIKDGEASWSDYMDQPIEAEVSKVEPQPTQPAKTESEPEQTRKANPQEQLQSIVMDAGFTFRDFHSWAIETKNFKDADSVGTFSEVPADIATRMVRAKAGLIQQLTARKGGAA